jgi:hypothetical protein
MTDDTMLGGIDVTGRLLIRGDLKGNSRWNQCYAAGRADNSLRPGDRQVHGSCQHIMYHQGVDRRYDQPAAAA